MKPEYRQRVGIVGALGAVGSAATRALGQLRVGELRLGARDLSKLQAWSTASGLRAELRQVDIDDETSLTTFCRDCDVVVNCAGPSFQILDRVAVHAQAAGAHYVDPGGDEPLFRKLLAATGLPTKRAVLLTAGMMPGLSALLTRRLVQESDFEPASLLGHVGGRGTLSHGGALDYLLSVAHERGAALSTWKQGQRVTHALGPITGEPIPFFSANCTAYPYLSGEMERVALSLTLAEVEWFNVFEGSHMLQALGRLQGISLGHIDLHAAARELSHAAELDRFGMESFQLFHLQLRGEKAGVSTVRRLVLRGSSAHELTACMTALATQCVLQGEVPAGLHYAGEILPLVVVDRLTRMPQITRFWEEQACLDSEEAMEGAV